MINILLCGGSGTRLWPVSRTLLPKQFVKLLDKRSLFQMTAMRNHSICDDCILVANSEHFFLTIDQLEEIDGKADFRSVSYLLEPIGRNTAPAIALACMTVDPDEVVLVTPSDHLVQSKDQYEHAVKRACRLAKEGWLVTFGTAPKHPETGYGYIEADGEKVISFKEKPDRKTAQNYLDANKKEVRYFWNMGIFCFTAGQYLQELQRYAPEIYETCRQAISDAQNGTLSRNTIVRIAEKSMNNIPSQSIDYAVMEKSEKVRMVVCDFEWNDLGNFDAIYEALPKDNRGNTCNENVVAVDAVDNLVLGEKRTIALLDIDNLIIVDTADALLIGKRGSGQKVRKVVEELEKRGSSLPIVHRTAHRPWGTYTVLEEADGYKIKKIVVKPGKRLSLQKHYHRSEHWVVVSGTATVTVEGKTYLVRPNESTYIKAGELHRLENRGKIPVVLIEAQVGEYTGEDDIVRIEDDFERF